MDKPPDHTAEQADICSLPLRMQFFPIYQKSSWLSVKKLVWHGPENTLDHAKRSFYCSINSIFGKLGRTASEEVIQHMLL